MKNSNPYSLTVTAIAIIAIALLLQQSCNGNNLIKSIFKAGTVTNKQSPQRIVKTTTDTITITEYLQSNGTSTVTPTIPDTIYKTVTDSIRIFDTIKLISYCTDTITITDSSIISKDSLVKVTLTDKITLNNIINRKYSIVYTNRSNVINNNTEIIQKEGYKEQSIIPRLLYSPFRLESEFGVGVLYQVTSKNGYGLSTGMSIIDASVQIEVGFVIPIKRR